MTPTQEQLMLDAAAKAVDDYGLIKAQIADLQAEARVIRDRIIATGVRGVSGDLYDATVAYGVTRDTLDRVKVARYLTKQQLRACTGHSAPATVVKITARKANAA